MCSCKKQVFTKSKIEFYNILKGPGIPAVVQWVKDRALSLWWHSFDPWPSGLRIWPCCRSGLGQSCGLDSIPGPRKFHLLHGQTKKEKKRNKSFINNKTTSKGWKIKYINRQFIAKSCEMMHILTPVYFLNVAILFTYRMKKLHLDMAMEYGVCSFLC